MRSNTESINKLFLEKDSFLNLNSSRANDAQSEVIFSFQLLKLLIGEQDGIKSSLEIGIRGINDVIEERHIGQVKEDL